MKIHVTRDSGYADSLRKYAIFVDDVNLESVKNGESITIEIPDDSRSIYFKIDWMKSNVLDVSSVSEEANIYVNSKLRGFKVFFALFIMFMPGEWLEASLN